MGIRVLKVDFRDKLNMKVIPISTSITFFINNLLSQFRLEELFGVLFVEANTDSMFLMDNHRHIYGGQDVSRLKIFKSNFCCLC